MDQHHVDDLIDLGRRHYLDSSQRPQGLRRLAGGEVATMAVDAEVDIELGDRLQDRARHLHRRQAQDRVGDAEGLRRLSTREVLQLEMFLESLAAPVSKQ